MFKTRFAFLMVLTGCSGAVDGNTSIQKQKLDAADARARGIVAADACEQHGWYGDGVCDSFCAREDEDCVAKPGQGQPVVCALFIESKNGVCGRTPSDPCRFQDPDCNVNAGGSGAAGDTVCAAVLELPDGECRRRSTDPCRGQDPDCSPNGAGGSGGSGAGGAAGSGTAGAAGSGFAGNVNGGSDSGGADSGGGAAGGPPVDCDTRKITCETLIAVEPCPANTVRSVVGQCYGECVSIDRCAPRTIPPPDGSGGSTGGTGADCDVSKVTCQTFVPVVCPSGQVPTVSGSCFGPCVERASCAEIYECAPHKTTEKPPQCPDGQVPSIVNGKYDRCVSKNACIGSACLAYVEESDGVCSRPYNDPCRGQDPDCSPY